MEPDDLLCSRNARPQKVWRIGVRSFLCSRSARPKKGLARRPQSKAPHTLAWLGIELEKKVQMDTRSRESTRPSPFGPSRSSRMSRVKETMRAVKGSLGHSFKERCRELECAHSTRALGDQSAPIPEERMSGLRSSLRAHHRLEISASGTEKDPAVIFFSSHSSPIARRKFE